MTEREREQKCSREKCSQVAEYKLEEKYFSSLGYKYFCKDCHEYFQKESFAMYKDDEKSFKEWYKETDKCQTDACLSGYTEVCHIHGDEYKRRNEEKRYYWDLAFAYRKIEREKNQASEYQSIFERIFNKSPMASEKNEYHFKNPGQNEWSWCGETPVWLRYCDKKDAQEIKALMDAGRDDYMYHRWLSKNATDFNDQSIMKGIGENKDEFIRELDEIINSEDEDDKPENPNNPEPKPIPVNSHECCEQCGITCLIYKDKTACAIKRKRYIKHKTDFTRENSCWFSTNCECARKFREANQQTCPHCQKHEFPHMKKGWLLDYELKQAFCSPLCHVTYRELKWEEANRLTQIEMFPPELEVSVNPSQTNLDWEQEGLKNEVLLLRELARETEANLNNQTNLTPEERLQSNYLRNLQQNTLRSAESSYQSRYGDLTEINPNNKGKGLSGGVISLLIVGVLAIVGGVIYFLIRNKRK